MPIDEKQLTNKQHAVPQNIMDVDFKIIGELTLREFFYLMIFFGLAYWAYMSMNNVLKWPLTLFFALTGLVFAKGSFGDRGFDEWVVNFFRAIYNPTQKIWKKSADIPVAFTYQNLDFVKNELITLAPTNTRRKLETYLESYNAVEVKKDSYEQKEEEFIKKVASFNYVSANPNASNAGTTVVVDDNVPQINVQAPQPIQQTLQQPIPNNNNIQNPQTQQTQQQQQKTQTTPTNKDPSKQTFELQIDLKNLYHQQHSQQTSTKTDTVIIEPKIEAPKTQLDDYKDEVTSEGMKKIIEQMKQKQAKYIEDQPAPKTAPEQKQTSTSVQKVEPKQEPQQKPTETKEKLENSINFIDPQEQPTKKQYTPKPKNEPIMPSITPDRVAGRRFTPLAMEQKGEIILPIRGEKTVRTNTIDEEQERRILEEKTKQLQLLLNQIREDSGIQKTKEPEPIEAELETLKVYEEPKIPEHKTQVAQIPQIQNQEKTIEELTEELKKKDEEKLNKLQGENQKLVSEISKLKDDMSRVRQTIDLQRQKQVLESANIEQEALRKQIEELRERLSKQDKETEMLRKKEQQRLEEERKQAETLKKMMELQKERDKKIAEEKRQEELRKLQEQKQKEQEERRLAEQKRIEEAKKWEEKRKAEEAQKLEQLRIEAQKKMEEQKRIAEEKQKAELKKQEEIRIKEEEEYIKAQKEALERKNKEEQEKTINIEQTKTQTVDLKQQPELKPQITVQPKEQTQPQAQTQQTQPQTQDKPQFTQQTQPQTDQKTKEQIQAEQKSLEQQKLLLEKQELENKIREEQRKFEEKQKQEELKRAQEKQRLEEQARKKQEALEKLKNAESARFAQIQPITSTPNAISGVVKSKEGKSLENTIVIIKRENGDPVRALKTNILGQFVITTPLTNGIYLVEVDKVGATGQKFDIIKVPLDGKVIPPLEFIGK